MSNRNTDKHSGFERSSSLFPLNASPTFTTGFTMAGTMVGSSTSLRSGQGKAIGTLADPVGPDAIEFRVTREGSPTRRLRLSGRRYTFGSGEGCSIRLSDSTLRPMHAVLIRDGYRVLIRAYSVPILVNGDRATEAVLNVGDLVQLGSYQLEMLGSEAAPHSDRSSTSDEPDNAWTDNAFKLSFADGLTRSNSRGGTSNLGREKIDRVSPLAAEENVWREQLRREIEQWRMAKAECERRETRCDDRETNMRERESELWNRSELLRRRESEIKAQESVILEIQDEYEAKRQSLERLQTENRTRREEFQRRETEFLRLEQEYQKQIEQVSQQLLRSQDQASVANEAVQRIRDQFTALNGQLSELNSKQSELVAQNQAKSNELRLTRHELELARDKALAERDSAIAQRDEQVLKTDDLVATRDRALQQLEVALAERIQAIRDRDDAENQCVQAIRNRDESIEQRNASQRERDTAIDAKAESEALRIKLTQELAQATQRFNEVEIQLAESRQLIEQNEQTAEYWKKQVHELQESVGAAKTETRLLRGEYEEACASIAKLEALVKDQARHGNEAKDSWMLEAEHVRRSFEEVSRDLAVALGELSELRDTNSEFASQLATVRAEKERIESHLESRPTPDAWNEMQAELERATESLQIIQRDYDATLTELNSLRAELQDERSWAERRSEKSLDEVNCYDQEGEPTSSTTEEVHSQWSDESEAVWPTYSSVPAPSVESALIDDSGASVIDDKLQRPIVDDRDVSIASTDDTSNGLSESMGWSIPQYPVDAPEAEIHDPIVDESESLNTPSVSESWRWSAADANEGSKDREILSDEIDEEPKFGSLAEQLIADLKRNDAKQDHDDVENDHFHEDKENEEFFEATSLRAAPAWPTTNRDSFDQPDESTPWNEVENSDDYERTAVQGELGIQSSDPRLQSDDEESEFTSPWSRSLYDNDLRDEDATNEHYGSVSTHDQDLSVHASSNDVKQDSVTPSEKDLSGSRVWTSQADSVVMDSELVVSDDKEQEDRIRPASTQASSHTPPPQEETFEDDSIEAYMNRLLQRVQGGSTASGDSSATQSVSKTAVTVATEPVKAKAVVVPAEDLSNTDPNSPLMPRSQAPEKNGSLNAMRQLANESARTAINRSVKIQTRDTQLKAFAKFASAFGLVVCAAAVYAFTHFPGTAIIACCMCVVAFVWVNEGIKLLGVARRRMELAAAGKLEQDEADEAKIDANQKSQVVE